MTDEEAKNVFKTIVALYPNFNGKGGDDVKAEVARVWLWKLKKGEYRMTMDALDRYSSDNRFPPTPADIVVLPRTNIRQVDYSEDIAKVQAEKADPEMARRREEKLKKLQSMLGGVRHD
jgi:hypothetical protein